MLPTMIAHVLVALVSGIIIIGVAIKVCWCWVCWIPAYKGWAVGIQSRITGCSLCLNVRAFCCTCSLYLLYAGFKLCLSSTDILYF
ncbi:hypothetical protein DPMN_111897 [Dreissena polymorpha]|uniref:Uncharacterized protein n=1 Tax=Dreissena polymorpha TaxID=45954 RepID=A0A9D4QQ66_DREPO|nr:hypothetical protein DPMN_111897 [Dreissena polymorpha]